MLILTENGAAKKYPYSVGQLRADNPNISFPTEPTSATLAQFNVYAVTPTAPPAHDPYRQKVSETTPVLTGDQWQQAWVVSDIPIGTVRARLVVTMRQARLALLSAGLLGQVDGAINAIEDPVERQQAQITWEFSTEVERMDPLVTRLGTIFGLTDTQIDDLFFLARTL
jgi:hypothetical protein